MIGGHDPCGGAGIQADIETAAAFGCHAVTVATALTVQNTLGVQRFEPVALDLLGHQLDALLSDQQVSVCKTGMLATAAAVELVAQIVAARDIALVVDPVAIAGSGGALSQRGCIEAIREHLLPLATIVTPNLPESRALTDHDEPGAAAGALLACGCRHVLITGTHADTADVVHRLYRAGDDVIVSRYARLPHTYHGSGCTLAAAIAACLAHGRSVHQAVASALDYTWSSLEQAYPIGHGQWIPRRTIDTK